MLFRSPVLAQEHAAAAQGEHATQEHAAQAEHATEGEHHDQSIGGMIKGMAWPVANFIVFVGVLYHFFNKPLADYLAGRSATIPGMSPKLSICRPMMLTIRSPILISAACAADPAAT